MSVEREILKRSLVALLDEIAGPHPLGHQASKAQRYVLTSKSGAQMEIMFEKNDKSPPNLWVLERAAGARLAARVPGRASPAAELWTERGKDGRPLYGRHSGLEKMSQLGEADLRCFAPENFEQVGLIVDRLLSVTPADLA